MLAEISIWCYFAIIELIFITGLTLIWCDLHNKIFMYKIYHKEIEQHIETIMLNEKKMYDNLMSLKLENLTNDSLIQMMKYTDETIHQNHELLLNIEAKIK